MPPANRTPVVLSLILLLSLLPIGACESKPPPTRSDQPESRLDSTERQLLGTWEAVAPPEAQITYRADGSWVAWFELEIDNAAKRFRARGTWEVKDGAIHNTTIAGDEVPGLEDLELPYLSVEKIVSLGASEYRYVCPAQGCTNTMRRVVR